MQYPFISGVSQGILMWLQQTPVFGALLILMALDVLTGVASSIIWKQLSSSASWRGMSKKVMMVLLVGVGAVLEPFAGGIPVSKLVASFYLFTEGLSIVENAAKCGVPLPGVLIDALVKVKEPDGKHVTLEIKPVDKHTEITDTTKPSGS